MKFSGYNNLFKYIFISVAVIIGISSLLISNELVKKLSDEERQKIELWAEATRRVATEEENADMELILQIISSNNTIPVILCDSAKNILANKNIKNIPDFGLSDKDTEVLQQKIKQFGNKHFPIVIEDDFFKQYVYYDDSYTLKQLQIFPYIQLGVLTIFMLISFLALLSTKKAEQNKVWVGLSKETAHQLGTPISSLMAWTEYLRLKDPESEIPKEIEKDVNRLQIVADRFSKIGSMPAPDKLELKEVVIKSVNYLQSRISKKVNFTYDFPGDPVYVHLNESLFSWVIENITKNAVDAMEGKGTITFKIKETSKCAILDITDTGKGIAKSKFNNVFMPGYTTKARGWGLGLSLTKRIIESYHKGHIFVKWSEIGIGTTFRIELKK